MTAGEWLLSKSSLVSGIASDVMKAITNVGGGSVTINTDTRYVYVGPSIVENTEVSADILVAEMSVDVDSDDLLEADVINAIMSADIEDKNE